MTMKLNRSKEIVMGLQQIQAVMCRTESERKSSSHKPREMSMKAESSTGSTVSSNQRAASAVVVIWARLAARYKSAFLSGHPSDPNSDSYKFLMKEWCDAIAGLTSQDIAKSFEDMKVDPRFKTYPPTSMAFRALCIDDEEEKERLFQELVNWKELDQDKKSRKGLYIAQKIDYTNFRRADLERARKMFNAVYSKLLKHIADGKELPEFLTEIEYEAPPPMPVEKRSAFFADLMASIK